MSEPAAGDVTVLLNRWRDGDKSALDKIVPLLRAELRGLAAAKLAGERADISLQPTELVNEAYLRLVQQTHANLENRKHFLSVAALIMRRILVDLARSKVNRPRQVTLDTSKVRLIATEVDLIALDEALSDLEKLHERQAKVVEYRFFGGLSVDETAAVLSVAPATVKRDWTFAKAWLAHELRKR